MFAPLTEPAAASGPAPTRRSRLLGDDTAAVLDRLTAVLDELATLDCAGLAARGQGLALREVTRARQRVDAEISRRLAAFDEARGWAVDGATSAAVWMREHAHVRPGDALARLEAGRVAAQRPQLAAAYSAGDVGTDAVRAIAGALDGLAEEQAAAVAPVLVATGTRLDPASVRRTADAWKAQHAPETLAEATERRYRTRATTWSEDAGMLLGRFALPLADGGHDVRLALEALSSPAGEDDSRTREQRGADAMVALARGALAAGDTPQVAGVRPVLHVLVQPEALAGGTLADGTLADGTLADGTLAGGTLAGGTLAGGTLAGGGGPPAAELESVGAIVRETLERLGCDSTIVRHVLDGAALPLSIGRQTRVIPSWMRHALVQRDRRCRAGCCGRPARYTDAHHIRAWQDGGETRLDNLVLLCEHHHRLVHHEQWQVLINADGTVTMTHAGGRRLESRPPGLAA